MPEHSLADRMEVVEKLTSLFRLERMVHLTVTIASLLIMLVSVVYLIARSNAQIPTLTLMFGSSGLITYSANRLLRMWDQALQVLTSDKSIKEN